MTKLKPFLPWIALAALVLFVGGKVFGKGGLLGIFAPDKELERRKEAVASGDGVQINMSKLSKTEFFLRQVADSQYQAMRGMSAFLKEKLLFDSLAGLNSDDLRYVYKQFGVKDDKLFMLTMFSADLFGWYQEQLNSSHLSKMKSVWRPTGLWG